MTNNRFLKNCFHHTLLVDEDKIPQIAGCFLIKGNYFDVDRPTSAGALLKVKESCAIIIFNLTFKE